MGKPREELWDFEETIYRHRPTDAGYYFLVRYGRNNQVIRAPETGTWRAREPFDEPIAPGGAWFVQYCKDSHGRERVHPVGKPGPLRVVLRWPGEASSGASTGAGASASAAGDPSRDDGSDDAESDPPALKPAADGELVKLLTSGLEEDDAEGSVKAARIGAKRMGIAMQQKANIYEMGKHQAFANEVVDCLKTNEFMRQQLRDQALINSQIQRESSAMLERTLALVEQVQLSAGRQNEREREASLRAASPPAPPDYTPVLTGIVKSIRDIGVAALQRDSRPQPPVLTAGSAATATLGPIQAQNDLSNSSIDPRSASVFPTSPPSTQEGLATLLMQASAGLTASELEDSPPIPTAKHPARPSYDDLLAQCEKLRAEVSAAEIRKSQPVAVAKPATNSTAECTSTAASSAAAPVACTAAPASSAAAVTAPVPVTPAAAAAVVPTAAPPAVLQREPEIGERQSTLIASFPVAQVPLAQSVPPQLQAPTPMAADAKETPSPAKQTNTHAALTSPPIAPNEPTADSASGAAQPTLSPEARRAFVQGELVQGILVNALAREILESDSPIPPPRVVPAQQVEKVLLDPPNMDPETAHRLLKDGSAIESFGAFLFFNPMIRDALLRGRGK